MAQSNTSPSDVVRNRINSPIGQISSSTSSNNNQSQSTSNQSQSPSQVVRDASQLPTARSIQESNPGASSSSPVQGPVQAPRRRSSSRRSSPAPVQGPVQQEAQPKQKESSPSPSQSSRVEVRQTQPSSSPSPSQVVRRATASPIVEPGTSTAASRVVRESRPVQQTSRTQTIQPEIRPSPRPQVQQVNAFDRTFNRFFRQTPQSLADSAREREPGARRAVENIGAAALTFPAGVRDFVVDPTISFIRSPIQSTVSAGIGVRDLVTQPSARSEAFSALSQQAGRISSGDPIALGETAGAIGGGAALGTGALRATQGVVRGGQEAFVRVGSRQIPLEQITSPEVARGQQMVPTTTSTAQSVREFERNQGLVSTASPSNLQGNIAGQSRKGAFGLEDGGIFVTPADRTSIAFTRIRPQSQVVESSINPLRAISFQRPTITTFQTTGVAVPPSTVTSQPGFRAEQQFLRQQAGTGKVFITKRSQIGTGDLPSQRFVADMDFNPGFKQTVVRDGQTIRTAEVRRGDILREGGSRELEGVIPEGSTFTRQTPSSPLGRLRGFDEFTVIEGRAVPIRRATVDVTTPSSTPRTPTTPRTQTTPRALSQGQIARETQALSSVARGTRRTSPTPSISGSISSGLSTPRVQSTPSVISTPSRAQSTPSGVSQVRPSGISSQPPSAVSTPFTPSSPSSSITSTPSRTPGGGGSSLFGGSTGGGGSSIFSGIIQPGNPLQPPQQRLRLPSLSGGGSSSSQQFRTQQGGGRYISTLGAALTGLQSNEPTRDQTGLRIRAIKINR